MRPHLVQPFLEKGPMNCGLTITMSPWLRIVRRSTEKFPDLWNGKKPQHPVIKSCIPSPQAPGYVCSLLNFRLPPGKNEEVKVTPVSNHDSPCIWVLKIRCIPKILLLVGENEVLHHGFIRAFPFNFPKKIARGCWQQKTISTNPDFTMIGHVSSRWCHQFFCKTHHRPGCFQLARPAGLAGLALRLRPRQSWDPVGNWKNFMGILWENGDFTIKMLISEEYHETIPFNFDMAGWKWSCLDYLPIKMLILHSYVRLLEGVYSKIYIYIPHMIISKNLRPGWEMRFTNRAFPFSNL